MTLAAATILLLSSSLLAQDWQSWGNDPGGAKYSALKQINKNNVAQLKVAWTYHTGEISDGKTIPTKTAFETTPLMSDGVLYFTTPFARLIAIDAETGKELWAFDPKLDKNRTANLHINRGAALWTDGKQKRLFYGTLAGRLYSINAVNGRAVDSFGDGGSIDLRVGVADKFPGKG